MVILYISKTESVIIARKLKPDRQTIAMGYTVCINCSQFLYRLEAEAEFCILNSCHKREKMGTTAESVHEYHPEYLHCQTFQRENFVDI